MSAGSGDRVLQNPDPGEDEMQVSDIMDGGLHAWVVGEKAKGVQVDTANPLKAAAEVASFLGGAGVGAVLRAVPGRRVRHLLPRLQRGGAASPPRTVCLTVTRKF